MKKFFKRLTMAIAVLVAAIGAFALYVQLDGIPRYAPPAIPDVHVEITEARLARGRELVSLTCAGCHENDETRQLTGRKMADLPPEFGTVYSKNITQHPTQGIGAMSDGELMVLLRTGLRADGRYVPPFMIKLPNLSDEDMASIIAFLRSGDPSVAASPVEPPGVSQYSFFSKVLAHTVIKPMPYPAAPIATPPRGDKVAYGKYMVGTLDCYSCHSPDFKTVNHLVPEKTPGYMTGGNVLTSTQGKIFTPNLTPDEETGIGLWTEAEFVRALTKGFRPDGRVLRAPMEPRSTLGEDEAAAIYAYLRTLPKVKHVVERNFPVLDVTVDDDELANGRRLYARYGCVSCHGDKGVGLGGSADLRRANEHFTTDVELRHWIEDAPSMRP